MKKLLGITSVVLATIISFPRHVYAQCEAGSRQTDFGCIPNNPIGFVEQLYTIGLGLIGMVSLLFMIYGGYHILTSRGDPEALEKGRGYIVYSIIGLLLAIFGFAFLQLITRDILRIPGFS